MSMARFTPLLIVISLFGILKAQYISQPVAYTLVPAPTIPNVPIPCDKNKSCRLAIEELGALVQLLKDLSNDDNCNARFTEDVIVRLVNALIYVATYTCSGTGYYPSNNQILTGGSTASASVGSVVAGASVENGAAAAGGGGGVAGVGAAAAAGGAADAGSTGAAGVVAAAATAAGATGG